MTTLLAHLTPVAHLVPSARLRTVALAALFGFTTFFVSVAPSELPLPRPAALAPAPVAALGCATEPAFTGHLTNTSATTTAATKSTTGGVYGYISDVLAAWSCTAYYRYDGLAWMRDDGEGDANYQWGTLINSTSVPCNWVVGETTYLKANGATHCHTSDADHAMQLQLDHFTGDLQEGVWHADNSPDAPGDFMFVHSDCTSYYAGSGTPGERMRWNVTFASTDVNNRPGTNCDPSGIDGTGTSQSVVVDGTPPVLAFDWPATGTGPTLISSPSVTVQFDATDNVAGFSGSVNDWDLQRQATSWSGTACGTSWTNDGSAVSGTTSALDQAVSVGPLSGASCYRWTLAATDANGNAAATITSGTIRTSLTGNLGQQPQHTFESWDLGGGDRLAVNVATGNLVISHPIVSLPIRGSSVDLDLTYNRHDPTNVGMGPGWRLDAFRRLAVNGDGSVTFTDGDGARHTFTAPSGAPTVSYTRPPSLYATLTRDTAATPDRFTLRYRDQSVDLFDELATGTGYLVREQDRFGNGVDLGYVGTELRTITDAAPTPDRVIDLTWTTGKVTKIEDWAYIDGSGVVQTSATGTRRATRFFYDGWGALIGWADPLNTSGSCPTGGSHLTCLASASGSLAISKSQTVTTLSGSTLGTMLRGPGGTEAALTTTVTFANERVADVTDAAEAVKVTPARTTFTPESSTRLRVERPTTTTTYGRVAESDPYARIASVWRRLDGTTSLETRTSWDATYPIEPASVTDNYGALLATPARTTNYTYVASSLGLLARIVEPLTATDDRWTEYVYNTNNDVVRETVSAEGADPTVTKSCYTTQSNSCSDAAPGLTLVRRIERWVSGGASDEDTNVVTDYAYDAYGRLTSTTRANRDPSGALLDAREDRLVHDDRGQVTADIVNHADGVVTANSLDSEPAPGGARTDLTTSFTYDTAGNRVSTADPRRAIAASATTYARDAFGRTVVDGWGTADTGGSWSGTTADHDVTGSVGTISLGSNTNRNAYLTSVSAQDAEILFKVKVDRLAVGSDHLLWAYLRRQDSSNYYQVRITFNTSQKLTTTFIRTAAGTSTTIDAATTTVPHAASDWYWVRARISGTTSVEGKIRLWRDGTTEPVTWDADGTDASPPATLQGAGHVGLRFQLGGSYSGSYPVIASVDELTVTSLGGGGAALGPDDYVSRSTYDALGQVLSQTTPTAPGLTVGPKTSTTLYDELGSARHVTDIAGLVTATAVDRAGRALTTYEDPAPAGGASVTSQATYDADGRILTAKDRRQVSDASLGVTATTYDGVGRTSSVTEASSSTPDIAAETRTTYDGLDRVTVTEVGYGSPASQRTELTLDLGGRATRTDDGYTCASATYDHRDLVLVTVDALDTSTCAANAASRTVTNAYDGLGRLVGREVTNGPDDGDKPTIATYDAIGNPLTSGSYDVATTTTSTTIYTRNRLDQVVAEARPDGADAKWTYDPVGNVADACTWAASVPTVGDCRPVGTAGWSDPPSTSTSTRWDARNGRIGLTDSVSNRTTVFDPDAGYQVSAIYLPTDAGQTIEHQSLYAYDGRHRLTSISHQLCTVSAGHACSSTTATGSVTYEYDDSDNRTRVAEHNGTASTDFRYCHDARDQLTGRGSTTACGTSSIETFAYDDGGNRTQAVEAGVIRNFAYTATGLLCDVETSATASCSGGNVISDDAGRISDQAGWHFEYDAEARLVSACKSSSCSGSGFERLDFAYDGAGHRTAITETPTSGSPVVWTFRYQGDAIVAEYRNGTLYREYVTDDAGTISKVMVPAGQTGAGTYLVTWNGHGDAMALHRIETSGSLTLANAFSYSTWGRPATTTHNGVADLGFRFLYVGAHDVQWDATYGLDLLYMHARHYSPSLGRFLQPDPSRLDAQLFVYAGNGPVTKIDPNGRESWAWNYAERRWCDLKGTECLIWTITSAEALAWAKPIQNSWTENAFRHCIWQCLLTARLSWSSAKTWAELHENYGTNVSRTDRIVDTHNNAIGRLLGRKPWAWTLSTAARLCNDAWKAGRLLTVRLGRIVYSNGRPWGANTHA